MPGGFCKYVVAGLRSEFLCSSLPEKCAVEAFYRPVEGASLSDLPVGPEALLRIGTGAASHFGCKVQVVQIYIFMRFAAFQHEPEHPSSIGTSFHRLNITKKQHTHTHTCCRCDIASREERSAPSLQHGHNSSCALSFHRGAVEPQE